MCEQLQWTYLLLRSLPRDGLIQTLQTHTHTHTNTHIRVFSSSNDPGWKIHRLGSSPGSALPSPVIVWTENKNVTISDHFICFILTVKRHWRPVFWGRQLFWGKKCIRVTWLNDSLTSKSPGSFTALAPPLLISICKCYQNHYYWHQQRY